MRLYEEIKELRELVKELIKERDELICELTYTKAKKGDSDD